MNINVYSEFLAVVPKFEKWYVGFNTFRLAFKNCHAAFIYKINSNTVIV